MKRGYYMINGRDVSAAEFGAYIAGLLALGYVLGEPRQHCPGCRCGTTGHLLSTTEGA